MTGTPTPIFGIPGVGMLVVDDPPAPPPWTSRRTGSVLLVCLPDTRLLRPALPQYVACPWCGRREDHVHSLVNRLEPDTLRRWPA